MDVEGEGVQVEEVREGFNGVAEEGRDGDGVQHRAFSPLCWRLLVAETESEPGYGFSHCGLISAVEVPMRR